MEKADVFEVYITDATEDGRGVGRAPDGRTVFVRSALPGDRVRCRVTAVKKRYAEAELAEIPEFSADRSDRPYCAALDVCGGCPFGKLKYEAQLRLKARRISSVLARISGETAPDIEPVIGMYGVYSDTESTASGTGARTENGEMTTACITPAGIEAEPRNAGNMSTGASPAPAGVNGMPTRAENLTCGNGITPAGIEAEPGIAVDMSAGMGSAPVCYRNKAVYRIGKKVNAGNAAEDGTDHRGGAADNGADNNKNNGDSPEGAPENQRKQYNYNNNDKPVSAAGESEVLTGFYEAKSHRIVDIDFCPVQAPSANACARALRKYMTESGIRAWDPVTGEGLLRSMTVRSSFSTGEVTVILSVHGKELPDWETFVDFLEDEIYGLYAGPPEEDMPGPETESGTISLSGTGIPADFHAADTCVTGESCAADSGVTDCSPDWHLTGIYIEPFQEKHGKTEEGELIRLDGAATLHEAVGDVPFETSPGAFWQVNSVLTEKLYDKIFEYACLSPGDSVLDIYCGPGAIGIYLSRRMNGGIRLTGIESDGAAVRDANRNAVINGIVNARFIKGRAEDILPSLVEAEEAGHQKTGIFGINRGGSEPSLIEQEISGNIYIGKPAVVILDPPRAGCRKELIDAVIRVFPDRIIYVSCEPATMARDIRLLSDGGYRLRKTCPVDMFPNTGKIECVVLMTKK